MKGERKLFLTRAGRVGEDESYALENNRAIVGFRQVGSLKGAKNHDEIKNIAKEAYPEEKPRAVGNYAGQLWAFALSMQQDDIVVLPQKLTSQIAVGTVSGPYRYEKVNDEYRHVRPVEWKRTDIPRATFEQDLLYSFGAFMTVCQIARNDAAKRVEAVLKGDKDPGPTVPIVKPVSGSEDGSDQPEASSDLIQLANDQIVAQIQARFKGHALSHLVDAVLRADGWNTRVSPPGPDGGVDIFAGRGPLGLDAPYLCAQVKSQDSPADVTVYRTLQGTMQTFDAEQGLLVCWGGFNKAVLQESRQGHFTVRLWDSRDLVQAIYRNYETLPAEIQADLPLKRVWMLVVEEPEE